ncbi:unnamed protein product [Rotaria sp. Silwood1]|nr:unnamed protein product [Rotaria sp. Silwood1]
MNVNGSKLEATSSADSTWIKVGLTTTSTSSRTVTIQPVSKTAVEGTDYTISKKVITFAPGQLIDSFYVKPINVANYLSGRKDTIVFNIVQPSVAPSDYNGSYQWILRGPCFASDINIGEFDALLGTYADSQDDPFGTPYYYGVDMSIKSWTQTGPTTARVVINNLWDDNPSWGDIPFTVDFTDPNDVHVLPGTTITAGNAGNTFGAAYNGMKIIVRAHTNGAYGTLDWCNQKWVLEYQIGIYNPTTSTVVGYSNTQFTSSLAR